MPEWPDHPTAIVTGAGSGIGRATARLLAEQGHDVAITYNRNERGAQEVVADIERSGRRALAAQLDLSRPELGEQVVERLAGELGGVGVLVNNAGINPRIPCL